MQRLLYRAVWDVDDVRIWWSLPAGVRAGAVDGTR